MDVSSCDIAISARNLTKAYRLFGRPADRLKQFFSLGLKRYHGEFTALNDVSFDIQKGETVGIMGRNGSGKSTLLQLICGILKPTEGVVQVNGRVSALLELGAGFNPEFTGRENVYFQGALMGFDKSQMDQRFDDIAAFAEIGEFIDQPVRTYSSGMFVRLAFAVQAFSDPDILIIDEALSVGDFFFQQKCLNRIQELCDNGTTLLFVSHDTSTIRDLCRRTIYLKEGRLSFDGETTHAMRQYFAERDRGSVATSIPEEQELATPVSELDSIIQDSVWSAPERAREKDAGRLIAIALYDDAGNPSTSFRMGTPMCVKVAYRPATSLPTHISMEVSNRYGQMVTSLGSSRLGLTPPDEPGSTAMIFEMRVYLQIEAGEYGIAVNLGRIISANGGETLDSTGSFGPIIVHWDYTNDPAPFFGMFGLPVEGKFITT